MRFGAPPETGDLINSTFVCPAEFGVSGLARVVHYSNAHSFIAELMYPSFVFFGIKYVVCALDHLILRP